MTLRVREPDDAFALTPMLPRELQVEVTAACNLRCRMCLVRYQPPVDRMTGSLGLNEYRRLVDALPGLERITLQGLGEPLLVPHLDAMVAYASRSGIAVGFNTNGTLLTPVRAERLVAAGLSWLHISVDGATPATYEDIRDGARFDRVRRGVRSIVEAKARLEGRRPELSLVFVAMRRNYRELADVVRLAADWGVERLWVQNLSHSFSDTDPDGRFRPIREFTAAEALDDEPDVRRSFDDARRVADATGVALRLPRLGARPAERRTEAEPGCDWPWRSAYVGYDGRVQPCCMLMGAERGVLGDLAEATFPEIWRGERYRRFRSRLLGDVPPDVCRGCSAYRGRF